MSLLAEIVETSRRVTETRARLAKVKTLAECLERLDVEEVPVAVGFLTGELRQGRIGLGYAAVRDVAVGAAVVGAPLSVGDVDIAFERILNTTGGGSKAERMRMLAELLGRGGAPEQEFIKRLVIGELRQGALEGVMLDAIAKASSVPATEVRRAAMLCGDTREVARAVFADGRSGLSRFRIELFRPVQPMLAQAAESVSDALARIGGGLLEWKIDGARIQVHRSGDEVRVFTRKLNDVTAAVPEIVEAVLRVPAREFVLDGEAIALRPDGGPQPFQITMRRFGRRVDVDRMRGEVPIVPYFFDCIHLAGDDLIDRPGKERLDALADVLPSSLIVPRLITADEAAADAFLAEALQRGHEGLVAKSLDASYEAGRRGGGWLKIKPTHTLDLVVLAAEWGSGRRQGWLSSLHLEARDPTTGSFVMLGKTFKGMTDKMLQWQTQRLQELEISRDAWTVYVRPEQVVEIAFDGVQTSPHYPGGVALRFARVKRYRADKTAAEADTIDTVRRIHGGQSHV